jgi:hypothetical protein
MRWSSERSLKGFGPGVPFGGGRVCARLCPRLVSSFRKAAGFPPISSGGREVSYQVSADVIRAVAGSPCGDFPFGSSGDSATGMQSLDSSITLYSCLQLSATVQLNNSLFLQLYLQRSLQRSLQPSLQLSTALYSSLMTELYSSFYKHHVSHRYAVARLF